MLRRVSYMLSAIRILGIILGVGMLLVFFAPSSEESTLLDTAFFSLLAFTGLLTASPSKFILRFVKGSVYCWWLVFVAVVTCTIHIAVLYTAAASLKASVIVLLIIYPIVLLNGYWYYASTRT